MFLLTIFLPAIIMADSDCRSMKGVLVTQPGGPEGLSYQEVEFPKPGPNEVLVKTHASSVNRADTMQRKGVYPPPPGATQVLGLEAVGEVVEDAHGWHAGDRVMTIVAGGGNAQYFVSPANLLIPIPSAMSYNEAAAISEVWLTAFQLISYIGKIQPGQTVLIHAGASGVGTALIQLCKKIGAKAIVTAGSEEKIEYCKSLGAMDGINYKTTPEFSEKVKELTQGAGVDLLLDPVGASHFEQNLASLKIDGTWILYGLMGGRDV